MDLIFFALRLCKILLILNSIAFIINPKTKYASKFKEDIYRNKLSTLNPVFYYTRSSGDEITRTQEAIKNGATTIVSVGGDGTLHNVLQQIIGKDITLAHIPTTLGSSFGRYLYQERRTAIFTNMLLNPIIQKMDLIKIEAENLGAIYASNFISFGFIAELNKKLTSEERRNAKPFWISMSQQIKNYRRIKSSFQFNYIDETTKIFDFLISNIDRYGGNVRTFNKASIFDGALDLRIVRKVGLTRFLNYVFKMSVGLDEYITDIADYHNASSLIKVSFDKPTNIQIDTEPYTVQGDLLIKIEPASQKLILPQGFKDNL